MRSFLCSAIILSYFGYKDEVEAILRMLSNNATRYYAMHELQLKYFLVVWTPDKHILDFGDNRCGWDAAFPDAETLRRLPRLQKLNRYALETICYGAGAHGALTSIQLLFTDGEGWVQTPRIDARGSEKTTSTQGLKRLMLDVEKRITAVAMRIEADNSKIYALRLT